MTTEIVEPLRAKRLKAQTHGTHDRLDRSIMSASSFDSIEGYVRFISVQYLFHRDIAALYGNKRLQALLPGLVERRRLSVIAQDFADLGLPVPESEDAPVFADGAEADIPTALGWLYVAEGSNMGAALLRKAAAKIGLSDTHGARQLAPAPEGPAAQWRAFTTALDAVSLTDEEDARVTAGTNAAFARVQALVDARIG